MVLPTTKAMLKGLFRVCISALALWIVFNKIDLKTTMQLLGGLRWGWLLPAVVFFAASHVVSADRLIKLWRLVPLRLEKNYNRRLYWVGMFYNLFLPGGIGGDGYKIFILKVNSQARVKLLISAGLLDRVHGLVALTVESLALSMVLLPLPLWLKGLFVVALILIYPANYLVEKLLFVRFIPAFFSTHLLSHVKQILQVICAAFLMLALGQSVQPVYLLLFLVSSLAVVLPVTIGGMGARELAIVYIGAWFQVDEHSMVAMTLLFFLITVVASLLGSVVKSSPVLLENGGTNEDLTVDAPIAAAQ